MAITTAAVRYEHPRRVWVEDGQVFVEEHDGTTLVMAPDVAIAMGRLPGEAGADLLINKVMDDQAQPRQR